MMQWLGSYCNQRGTRCCYPPTGKPKPDFTIYGLWPYYNDGSFPYNCGDDNYDVGRVKSMTTTPFYLFSLKILTQNLSEFLHRFITNYC